MARAANDSDRAPSSVLRGAPGRDGKSSPGCIQRDALQVLDDGRLTDGRGRVVSFRAAIIIATSNVGSQFIAGAGASGLNEEARKRVMDALRAFRPSS